MSNKEHILKGATNDTEPRLKRGETTISTKVTPQAKAPAKASKGASTKAVAKVVEKVKKPTVKELQQQVENLSVQLVYANTQVTVQIDETKALLQELNTLQSKYKALVDECEWEFSKSWWTITKERFMLLFV